MSIAIQICVHLFTLVYLCCSSLCSLVHCIFRFFGTRQLICPLLVLHLELVASCSFQANFARAVASFSKAQAKKVARFLPNPEKHWGPKLRAGRKITGKHVPLLGTKAVRAFSTLKVTDEPAAKRKKTEDLDSNSGDTLY